MNEEAIFHLALEKHASERAAVLEQACGGDAALRQRVERLLQAHEMPASFMNPPVAAGSAFDPTLDVSVGPTAAGTTIGRYKLLEQIGEGGYGTVFMAEQTEPVQRKVALKIIKAGMDTRQVIARFEAERQALALMDHPNIAKVFDAGTTDAGRPYFVMELVKGIPITRYCDDHHLTPRDRLELFIQVCQAVQHAHQKGIIHRDIKPTNVLIALYDGKPVPKVIDFGVAKATGQQLTQRTMFTGFGDVIGTLEYMSPEQAEVNQLDVDTRSDIYSLGVLLYELLTGTTPLERDRAMKAGLLEMLRVVREEEPLRPSLRLSTSERLPSIAANRGLEPKKLSGMVLGELDWIVMKALEKDRARRYDTANGFAADVQRYLAGEAVQAVPPSRGYGVRKFLRRNQGPAVAGAVMALLLLAGTTISTWQAVRAMRAAEREAHERTKAEEARASEAKQKTLAQAKEAEANAVVKFFEERVFSAARPKGQDGGQGRDVSLHDAITASLPALETSFADQPLVEARLRNTLGITFLHLGEAGAAEAQYSRALALYTKHLGPDHPYTLNSMQNLANSYVDLGRHAEAMKLYEETLAAKKRVLPADHPDTLRSMQDLATCYSDLGRNDQAVQLYEQTVAAFRRVLPADHPDTLIAMHNLAGCYADLGRHDEALRLYEQTLAACKRVLPPDHPVTRESMQNLASVYDAVGRYDEALKLREQALAVFKSVLPADHPKTLWSMQQLANSYESLGRHDEALKLREQTLAAKKRVLPPDHPDMLFSSQNLAASYEAVGRYSEALKLDEETLAACKRVFAADHPVTLACMWGIADCLVKLDRGTEAVPIIDECLALAAGKPVNPRMIPEMMDLRLRHFQKASDPAGCRTTAAMWEKLDRHDAASLYNAACFRAVTAAVQAKAGGADAQRLAREDADKAMQWLTGAAGAGWHDPAQMEKDADLDPLRERADFRKLLAALDTEVNENVAATRQSFRREPDKPSEGTTQPTAVSSPDARASPP